ncbi:hypothetical protein [Hydrogenimonas cancrithermarum]|uniref:hypothetical protein n=1 Tax=Hydrogenimonas cancrithermarum TaxID=2993563 RepID=UPI0025727214|nr:hypothetical protein [Hydrogenimonas cancrithermarum]
MEKFESFQHREWYIAEKLKPLLFRKFRFKNYIVLSNSMLGFFRSIDKEACLYDYQHGVITSSHSGYIRNETAAEHIERNKANVLLYGDGFKDVLCRADKKGYYLDHAFVIGQRIRGNFRNHFAQKSILFSLQFSDPNPILNNKLLEKIVHFFDTYQDFFIDSGITLLLKHHPRFSHDIDDSALFRYPFTHLYKGSLSDALQQCSLHLTFHSTTTFEAAAEGIPTLLWENDLLDPRFFIDDYRYPLGIFDESSLIQKIKEYLSSERKYLEEAKKVFMWFQHFYSPLDETKFLKLMKE